MFSSAPLITMLEDTSEEGQQIVISDRQQADQSQESSLLIVSKSSPTCPTSPTSPSSPMVPCISSAPDEEMVKLIVHRTLDQMQNLGSTTNVETLKELLVPKVLYELHGHDQLRRQVDTMKDTLENYVQHSKVLSEDIAEIFLDLHNIYTKLDRVTLAANRLQPDNKFEKRMREAKQFLEKKKHFITNDEPEANEPMSSSHGPITYELVKKQPAARRAQSSTPNYNTANADRSTFLTNMLIAKKSDFSLELNHNKTFFSTAQKMYSTYDK